MNDLIQDLLNIRNTKLGMKYIVKINNQILVHICYKVTTGSPSFCKFINVL